MPTALIIDRIRASLAAGELASIPQPGAAVTLTTVGDLLRPWDEVFPGQRRGDDDAGAGPLFGYGKSVLQKPKFHPQPRRSRRALLPPRIIAAPAKIINASFFASIAAVWKWYQGRALADPALLAAPLNGEELNAFVMPLCNAVSDWYPLGICLEEFGLNGELHEARGIYLVLPHWNYDEEGAGVFEAFLSGWEGVEWLLRDLRDNHGDDFLNLPDEDRALLKKVPPADLARVYAEYSGQKLLDVTRLQNWTSTVFAEVGKAWPQYDLENIPLIVSDTQDVEIWVTSPTDIDFALAYAEAYETLTGMMLNAWDVENNEDREADKLVHDICDVWRKLKRQKRVPLPPTLSEIFRNEE